jgi:hypothetical protein
MKTRIARQCSADHDGIKYKSVAIQLLRAAGETLFNLSMKSPKPVPEREKIRRSIDDGLITDGFTFPQFYELPRIQITKGSDQVFLDTMGALVDEGCNGVTLSWALRVGRVTRGKSRGAVPPAKRIKILVSRLIRLADEIEKIEKGGFLAVIARQEILKLWKEKHLDLEEVEDLGATLPHLSLPRWMRKKADMYERWAKLASEKIPPKSGTMLTRLEYLIPAVYIKKATGKNCFPLLVQLLDTIGVPITEEQLSRDLKALKTDYRVTYAEVLTILYIVGEMTFC